MKAIAQLRERVVGMKTCHDVGRILQEYLDGDLDGENVSKVAEHLEHCQRCGLESDAYLRIKKSLARVGREGRIHPEDQLSIERLRRFAETLRA